MIGLQLLVEVPEWAHKQGLNDKSFNILEQIVLSPGLQEKILSKVDEGTRCCILQALEYATAKGLLNDNVPEIETPVEEDGELLWPDKAKRRYNY